MPALARVSVQQELRFWGSNSRVRPHANKPPSSLPNLTGVHMRRMQIGHGGAVFAVALLAVSAWPQSPAQTQHHSVAVVIDDSASAGKHQADVAKSVQHFLRFFTADAELC